MAVHIPPTYPQGGPLYWMDEQSGQLAVPICAYLQGTATPDQLQTVINYCRYWIQAPCWEANPFGGQENLQRLRTAIAAIDSHAALQSWLDEAMDCGIDPL